MIFFYFDILSLSFDVSIRSKCWRNSYVFQILLLVTEYQVTQYANPNRTNHPRLCQIIPCKSCPPWAIAQLSAPIAIHSCSLTITGIIGVHHGLAEPCDLRHHPSPSRRLSVPVQLVPNSQPVQWQLHAGLRNPNVISVCRLSLSLYRAAVQKRESNCSNLNTWSGCSPPLVTTLPVVTASERTRWRFFIFCEFFVQHFLASSGKFLINFIFKLYFMLKLEKSWIK